MKAITVRQPWAWAIIAAGKDVENRSWSTSYRGRLAIHAGAKWDRDGHFQCMALAARALGVSLQVAGDRFEESPASAAGSVVGVVTLRDVATWSVSQWWDWGSFAWELGEPVGFGRPIPRRGALGLWEFPDCLIRDMVGG